MGMPTTDDWLTGAVIAAYVSRPFIALCRRRNAGAVLLDLGGSKDRVFVFVFCTVPVVSGIVGMFRIHRIMFDAAFILAGVGGWLIAWQTMRIQLREAGFWNSGRPIPWDRIEAFEVSEIGTLSLKLPGESLQFYCDVPPALRAKAEDVLASKCHAVQPNA